MAKIIKLKSLIGKENIQIPTFQRPYKWNIKHVNQLIDKSTYRRYFTIQK